VLQVDWNLIGWFAGTFIVMVTFGKTEITAQLWSGFIGADADFTAIGPLLKLTVAVLVLSNIVSNVPLILLMAPDILAMSDPHEQVRVSCRVVSCAGR
jgi:Na+/H+ antiporter NhaD/arsenite permease-like protein